MDAVLLAEQQAWCPGLRLHRPRIPAPVSWWGEGGDILCLTRLL